MSNEKRCLCGKEPKLFFTPKDGWHRYFCSWAHYHEYRRAKTTMQEPMMEDISVYDHRKACEHIPAVSGVYCITNDVTGDQYVGCAGDINARCRLHRSKMLCGTHLNERLAKAADEYGIRVFRFDMLEHVTDPHVFVATRESYYIHKLRPAYNIAIPLTGKMAPLTLMMSQDDLRAIERLGVTYAAFIRDAVQRRLDEISHGEK
jgi:hypothetical protein